MNPARFRSSRPFRQKQIPSSNSLRGMSQGRASYAMEPLDYREVPANIAKEIMAKQGTGE